MKTNAILCLMAVLCTAAPTWSQVVLQGSITTDMTLVSTQGYLLRGAVFVDSMVTLTIEPGTLIKGERATTGTLIIRRGAQIIADGTAEQPIVFTSDQASPNRGDWGGLIINGRAPINTGLQAEGEGNTGFYGGNDPDDSSGILRYVRVEYAGIEFSPDNELNGIAFQGVGRGTIVDYCQVHMNQDDGIEFFGGTVDAKHLVCTNIRDDNFDWTDGWVGRGQFWVCQQRGDDADNGIEADNNGESNDLLPRSNPMIYNVTLIGDPTGEQFDESRHGMLLREGTAGHIRNAIVLGFNRAGLDVDHEATFALAESGELSVQNSIFHDNRTSNYSTDDDGFDEGTWAQTPAFENLEAAVCPVVNPYANQTSSFASTGPGVDGTVPVAVPPDDGFFDISVDFIGAVGPEDLWTLGWTTIDEAQEIDEIARPSILLFDHTPNPVTAAATLSFTLASAGPVQLTIHDLLGRAVSTFPLGTYDAGVHHVTWDTSRGEGTPSGIYFCRLAVNGTSTTRTIVVAR